MIKAFETEEQREQIILVAVDTDEKKDVTVMTVEQSLDELQELAETAGAQTVGRLIQKREAVHPGTYIGKGKIDELKNLIWEQEADAIVCDDELSPAQITNLSEELQVKAVSYTHLTLPTKA